MKPKNRNLSIIYIFKPDILLAFYRNTQGVFGCIIDITGIYVGYYACQKVSQYLTKHYTKHSYLQKQHFIKELHVENSSLLAIDTFIHVNMLLLYLSNICTQWLHITIMTWQKQSKNDKSVASNFIFQVRSSSFFSILHTMRLIQR